MDEVEKIIEEIYEDDPKLYPLCGDIGSRISKNELKLVSVIEALGPKLTDKDAMTRSKAMNILAAIFASFEPDLLSEVELSFIVDFLYDRLRDQHVVIPKVIHCIKAIISCKNLPTGAAGKLLLQLFKEANIQSHVHKDRHAFFLILSYILDEKVNEINEWKTDFVMYFIQSMDGEKDPRNLLLIFRLVPKIINELPIDNFVEDLFEVLSCYFPVDFNPTNTKEDAEIITRESLAQSLHHCLSHTSVFAAFLIPLILDKLESTLVASKLDSMKLLEMCCKRSYGPHDLEPFLPSLWRVLSKEIFLGANESINSEILQLITAVFETLSKSEAVLNAWVTMVFNECKHHLMEPELRLMQPASSILLSVATASESACCLIVTLVLPLLYDQFLAKSVTTERKAILEFFNRTVTIAKTFPAVKFAVLLQKWEDILATLFNLLSHEDREFVNLSLHFYQVVCADLDASSVSVLQAHLLNLISGPKAPSAETRHCIMSCLDTLAYHFPESVVATTVQALLKSAQEPECREDPTKLELVLTALAESSYVVTVADVVLPSILHEIKLKASAGISEGVSVLSSLHELGAYCHCLYRVVEKGISGRASVAPGVPRSPHDLQKFLDLVCKKLTVVDVLVNTVLHIRHLGNTDELTDEFEEAQSEIYGVATDIVRMIMRVTDEVMQENILSSFDSAAKNFSQFPGLLQESVVGCLRRSVAIPNRNLLMQSIWDEVMATVGSDCRTSSLDGIDTQARIRLFATLLNKMDSDAELQSFEEKMEKTRIDLTTKGLSDEAQNSTSPSDLQNGNIVPGGVNYVVELLTWAIKALAMRGANTFEYWMERTVAMLGSLAVGSILADKFEVLLEDSPYSMNLLSHCNFRFLYKQRIFLSSVPKLVSAYRSTPPEDPVRVNYIRALSCQLCHVSQTVLHMELDNVLPLLVASLTCEDSSVAVRKSSLDALYNLLTDTGAESPLIPYFHDVVPYLTKMANFRSSMDIRIIALKCLRKLAKFPTHMVLQEKSKVAGDLKATLDDPKRLVRKEAVITRNMWILTGAPGGL